MCASDDDDDDDGGAVGITALKLAGRVIGKRCAPDAGEDAGDAFEEGVAAAENEDEEPGAGAAQPATTAPLSTGKRKSPASGRAPSSWGERSVGEREGPAPGGRVMTVPGRRRFIRPGERVEAADGGGEAGNRSRDTPVGPAPGATVAPGQANSVAGLPGALSTAASARCGAETTDEADGDVAAELGGLMPRFCAPRRAASSSNRRSASLTFPRGDHTAKWCSVEPSASDDPRRRLRVRRGRPCSDTASPSAPPPPTPPPAPAAAIPPAESTGLVVAELLTGVPDGWGVPASREDDPSSPLSGIGGERG